MPILAKTPNTSKSTSLDSIRHLVKADFDQVNALIEESLYSDVEIIRTISQHIIHSGGKRLRPLLTLLSAKMLHYTGDAHIFLAVIIEFIHTATLLHDDVVDASTLRRGLKTANTIWGNPASVLVGDFLYSRAFQLMTHLNNTRVCEILAETTNTIAQGEVLQLINRHNPDVSEDYYLEVIRCKTAVLFASATELGALAANASQKIQQNLHDYGYHLGIAFQLIDDWLDYIVSPHETGKNCGDDLAEGKVTLLLIHAMQHAKKSESSFIRRAIRKGGLRDFDAITEIMHATQSGEYVKQLAYKHIMLAQQALSEVPQNECWEALMEIGRLVVERRK